MTLHTDTETLDRWRATGTWVMFGEGIEIGGDECGADEDEPDTLPPVWMVEAAKPCEHPADHGDVPDRRRCLTLGCNGKRRIAITVPCDECQRQTNHRLHDLMGHWTREGIKCDGRITAPEWAVVEWGPLAVVEKPSDANGQPYMIKPILSDTSEVWTFVCQSGVFAEATLTPITLPPDVDPQSLVGQHALCGKLVTP